MRFAQFSLRDLRLQLWNSSIEKLYFNIYCRATEWYLNHGSVQAKRFVPLFSRGTIFTPVRIACSNGRLRVIKLEGKTVIELFYLLVFVWSPRSEI